MRWIVPHPRSPMYSPQLQTYNACCEVCHPREYLGNEEFTLRVWASQLERDYFRDYGNNTKSDLLQNGIIYVDLQAVGRTTTSQEIESIDGSSFNPTISAQIGPIVSVSP